MTDSDSFALAACSSCHDVAETRTSSRPLGIEIVRRAPGRHEGRERRDEAHRVVARPLVDPAPSLDALSPARSVVSRPLPDHRK